MSADNHLRAVAEAAAEEILRTIYGDDFAGCTVPLDRIAAIVFDALVGRSAAERDLIELYEKANEALRLLATPPPSAGTLAPPELQSLLSERLDTIRTLTHRIAQATGALKDTGLDGSEE